MTELIHTNAKTITRNCDATVARYRQSMHDQVKSHLESIARLHANFSKRVADIRRTADGLNLLAMGGFKNLDGAEPQLCSWDYDGEKTIETTAKMLPLVRKLIGPVKKTEYKRLVPRSKSKIWVEVRSVEFPGITFHYQTKLPPDAKCRIVKSRYSSSSRRLVCSM